MTIVGPKERSWSKPTPAASPATAKAKPSPISPFGSSKATVDAACGQMLLAARCYKLTGSEDAVADPVNLVAGFHHDASYASRPGSQF